MSDTWKQTDPTPLRGALRFTSSEERDAYIDLRFPHRLMTDRPGLFDLPDRPGPPADSWGFLIVSGLDVEWTAAMRFLVLG